MSVTTRDTTSGAQASAETDDSPAPQARLTTAQVYEALRRKILDHSIPPATKVNIHHISQEFGVSPTPVREALRLLQGDNLLVATSNKGYATTEILDPQGVRDLFEFRLLFEPWAAGTAAANRLGNPAAQLRQELDSFPYTTAMMQQTLIAHDNRFHTAILTSAGNLSVLRAFEQSHCHLHLFRMYTANWDFQATIAEHEEVAQAMANADPQAAEEAMKAHIHAAFKRFSVAMDELEEEDAFDIRATGSARLVDGS